MRERERVLAAKDAKDSQRTQKGLPRFSLGSPDRQCQPAWLLRNAQLAGRHELSNAENLQAVLRVLRVTFAPFAAGCPVPPSNNQASPLTPPSLMILAHLAISVWTKSLNFSVEP